MNDEPNTATGADAAETRPLLTDWPDLPQDGMLDKILKIIVEEGKVDAAMVAPDATLESLGLVSIDVVSILMGIEDEFDAYIPMSEDLSTARNLAELIFVVSQQMQPDDLKNITSKS